MAEQIPAGTRVIVFNLDTQRSLIGRGRIEEWARLSDVYPDDEEEHLDVSTGGKAVFFSDEAEEENSEEEVLTPWIYLDNGSTIYGFECYWMTEVEYNAR